MSKEKRIEKVTDKEGKYNNRSKVITANQIKIKNT